ncbi:MAG: ABC transporter substrate-binding protein [bacterium]|nr:ABC transporter substrate-binding protein [bacterium]
MALNLGCAAHIVRVQRQACCALMIATVLLCGCDSSANPGTTADGKDKVTLMLNWHPEAEHGGFYAAKVHGIFDKYGLDVEIRPGGPAAPVAQELVMGRVQFAIGNADDVLVFRQQDVPVVALMAPIQNTPRCILVHEASSAKTLSDLRGMTLQAGSGRPYLKFMEAQGLLEGVQIVPYSGVPNLVANPDSAMQAYSFSEPLLAQQEGVAVRQLMLSEIGFNPYASCLLATQDYITGQSDIVGRMVQACREGWQQYFESPEETNAAILAANEHGMTMEALKFGVDKLRPLCITSEVDLQSMGNMTSARWETLVEQFVKIDLVDADKVTASQVFTLEFLQSGSVPATTP